MKAQIHLNLILRYSIDPTKELFNSKKLLKEISNKLALFEEAIANGINISFDEFQKYFYGQVQCKQIMDIVAKGIRDLVLSLME